jgi:uncharacterized protein (DUF433 family)
MAMIDMSKRPDERESPRAAAVAIEEHPKPVGHSDPEIMGGEPVFIGTRVPLNALFDYLEGNHSLDEFLDDFPTVNRAQALAALHIARWAVLMASARSDR